MGPVLHPVVAKSKMMTATVAPTREPQIKRGRRKFLKAANSSSNFGRMFHSFHPQTKPYEETAEIPKSINSREQVFASP
jgi:hypothetical protein